MKEVQTPEPRPQPLVTVIAVCYNHERWVKQSLRSIARQEYADLELIIMDDASSDGSVTQIQEWLRETNEPATFMAHETNKGLCATLNEALTHASGKYVAILDTDDLMEPERLQVQVAKLEDLPDDYALVYSDASLIDENGELTGKTLSDHYWEGSAPPEGDLFKALLEVCFMPSGSVLVRRDALTSTGGYDDSLLFEDWDMWLRLSRRYKVAYSPLISLRYRVHRRSMSQSMKSEMAVSSLQLLAKWLGDSEARPTAIRSMRLHTHQLWVINRKASLPHLRKLCALQPGMPSQARYYLARLGVSYQTYTKIARLAGNRRTDNKDHPGGDKNS